MSRALAHQCDVQQVTEDVLKRDPWQSITAAVVLGSAVDKHTAARILEYVENGGVALVAEGVQLANVDGVDGAGTHTLGGGNVLVGGGPAALKTHLGVADAPQEAALTPLYIDGDTDALKSLVQDAGDPFTTDAPDDAGKPQIVLGDAPDNGYFSVSTYRKELESARQSFKAPWTASVWGASVRLADTLGYAEVTTSTQTLLECPKLQRVLPDGTIFMATRQIAARGRGKNKWISPVGCLQFSALWRQPITMAARVVFVQYLVAISIVTGLEHAFGEQLKGRLRIKWPNDVYAEVNDPNIAGVERTIDGRRRRYAKIGGVLVNAATQGSDLAMVIGEHVLTRCRNQYPQHIPHALSCACRRHRCATNNGKMRRQHTCCI
ncbi:hypothetical protein MCUN1_002094 [Malassezia cuniculi]|uniref:BPL/LPL catalytic domain-containing protein n=1 Tax=Malassezia cuniculi TaxID=948313 RepID=A0AAF0EZ30_9BASI|nr:hypothetical protein MCUN1_002094 [Malassezia cuniculi]